MHVIVVTRTNFGVPQELVTMSTWVALAFSHILCVFFQKNQSCLEIEPHKKNGLSWMRPGTTQVFSSEDSTASWFFRSYSLSDLLLDWTHLSLLHTLNVKCWADYRDFVTTGLLSHSIYAYRTGYSGPMPEIHWHCLFETIYKACDSVHVLKFWNIS